MIHGHLSVPASELRMACNRAGICLSFKAVGHEDDPCICSSIPDRRCRDCREYEGTKHDQFCSLVSIDHPIVTEADFEL